MANSHAILSAPLSDVKQREREKEREGEKTLPTFQVSLKSHNFAVSWDKI